MMLQVARQRFQAASPTASMAGQPSRDRVGEQIEPLVQAICWGHDQWRGQALFRGIRINGVNAVGGSLEGPALAPFIRSRLPPPTPGDDLGRRHGAAVAEAISGAWTEFQRSFSVPGLVWYPTFAAVAGPVAPPTPNVPSPLSSCTSDRSRVAARTLRPRMDRHSGPPDALGGALFDALAHAFESAVDTWLATQMVTNVLGQGPVPSYAPPHSPVGPVMAGTNLPSPGHLSA